MAIDKQHFYDSYISESGLIDQGWTKGICKKHLPSDPDKTKPNPHYKSGPPMRLYHLRTIRKIERRKLFNEALEDAATKRSARRAAAAKAVATKKAPLLEWANTVPIEINVPTTGFLKKVIQHYNDHRELFNQSRGNYGWQPHSRLSDFDPENLWRISGNYLRHVRTFIDGVNYDYALGDLERKIGRGEAYAVLRKRVDGFVDEKLEVLSELDSAPATNTAPVQPTP